ncbi:DUF2934 domain-containing protein [Bosea sp. 685]|uniref:DUF2934 domain-containing protein n=1 Tax=Bosea sp. 685 TaxID=3080057 RepID=UPI002892FE57|nr:DUF2934 domain-containing protein [Bosea sp. 685]WNJ92496.1 DUF2934 domain-containing protein [Bosea sp. 685]
MFGAALDMEPSFAIAVVTRRERRVKGRHAMSREQIVRDTAYAIWEAEGKPEGRDLAHWRQAEARVAESAAAKAKPEKAKPAKTMPAAKGKAPVSVAKSSAKAAPPDKTATSAKKG